MRKEINYSSQYIFFSNESTGNYLNSIYFTSALKSDKIYANVLDIDFAGILFAVSYWEK